MIEPLKPFYNAILKPAVKLFIALGIKPNHLTIFGTVIFIASGYMTAVAHWYGAAALLVFGACMDGWDGLLAREANLQSTFGAILDSCCDRITEIALLLGALVFYAGSGDPMNIGVILCYCAMAGSIMVSYVKARCEGAGVVCRGGIMQRPERLILLGLGLLLGPKPMLWILGGLALLSWYTTIERLVIASRAR